MKPLTEPPFSETGLTHAQASAKLLEFGFNELPTAKRRNGLTILIDVFREPMFLLLMVCAITYLLLGDLQEGVVLLFSVAVIAGITLFQEAKSENALEALKVLSSPRALVIREGREIRIPGREIVPGDLIILREGDRVPADGVLITSRHLRIDESLLTGESYPVTKAMIPTTSHSEQNRENQVFSGTLVIGGMGVCKVLSTGTNTEVGKIGKSLEVSEEEPTLLQRQISRLVRVFATIGVVFSFLIVLSYGFTVGDWPQGFLAGIAAAMSLLPEELPVILTVFFAIGAWRISKRNVLTRKVTAIENLGAISILCVDKTGTLTKNEMVVRALMVNGNQWTENAGAELPEEFHQLIEYGVLASQIDPFDPMEKAILKSLQSRLSGTEHVHKDWKLIQEYPLSHELLAMSCVWESPEKSKYSIAAKGAPEAIADLCHLNPHQLDDVHRQVKRLAEQGMRVLGVAQARFSIETLPSNQHDFDFELIGLIGLEDPVRPEAKSAIQECYEGGIRVIMMTGDYGDTARHIAQQIGIQNPERVVLGSEIEEQEDHALHERISGVNIFARMVPDQKLRLVKALKSQGAVVAMTGDGVNDAPSLKWADVGIAMGHRGTDVARESSDIVLLDDNFTSIVAGIRMGRRIFDNIQRAISYVFSVHVPIAGIAILPVLVGLPIVLMPIHIVFLELLIDPACSLVFEAEPEETNVMRRAPRLVTRQPFGPQEILRSSLHGLVALILIFGLYWIELKMGAEPAVARATAFAALTFSNIGLIVGNLSGSLTIRFQKNPSQNPSNKILPWILVGAFILILAVLYIPYLQHLFQFSSPSFFQLGKALVVGWVIAFIVKFAKYQHA